MNCPRCHASSQVLNSRQEGETRWRRHLCKQCSYRFTTYEIPAELYDKVLAVTVDAGQFDKVIAFLRNLKVQFGSSNGTTKD